MKLGLALGLALFAGITSARSSDPGGKGEFHWVKGDLVLQIHYQNPSAETLTVTEPSFRFKSGNGWFGSLKLTVLSKDGRDQTRETFGKTYPDRTKMYFSWTDFDVVPSQAGDLSFALAAESKTELAKLPKPGSKIEATLYGDSPMQLKKDISSEPADDFWKVYGEKAEDSRKSSGIVIFHSILTVPSK
jgi:hypothetical protein